MSDHEISKKEFEVCRRCGRKLKSKESKILGFGPNCYKKYLKDNSCSLFKLEL